MVCMAKSLHIILTSFLLTACTLAPDTRTAPVTVTARRVQSAEHIAQAGYVGHVEAERSALVSAPYGGTVATLPVSTGQRVSQGTTLATLQSESVQAAYDMAAATLRQAQDGFERVQKVHAEGAVTEQKYIEIEAELQKATAAERAARKALDDGVVTAPFSGTVSEVMAERGVHVDAFAPLVRIVDVSRMEIAFEVPEGEFASVAVGDSAVVTVPALGRQFTAIVVRKGITASALAHSYGCTLGGFEVATDLLPGMVCKVQLLAQGQSGVLVPASAVMTGLEGRYVWTADEQGRVDKRLVTVDGFAGKDVVVTSGLADGDRVITEGTRKVSTGMTVTVVEP